MYEIFHLLFMTGCCCVNVVHGCGCALHELFTTNRDHCENPTADCYCICNSVGSRGRIALERVLEIDTDRENAAALTI